MILIEHNGERQLVHSLEGHDGCKIIAKNVPHPPSDHCTFWNGKWKPDAVAKEKAEREASIRGLGSVGRFEELELRIAELEATVAVLAEKAGIETP